MAIVGAFLAVCWLIYLVRPLFRQAVVSGNRVMADEKIPMKCPGCNCTFFYLIKNGKMVPEVNECRWCGQKLH